MGTTINGTELEWRDRGTGDPILLIHGFPLNSAMWGAQLAGLSHDRRLIAPDLRGFGASDIGPDPVVRMEQLAGDAAGLLDHLGIEKAVICGISMGGYVAFEFARHFPARVRALVLVDTRAAPDSAETRRARESLAERVREGNTIKPVIDGLLPKLLSPQTFRSQPGTVEMVRAMMQEASPDAVARTLRGMAERADSEPLLRSIEMPCLVVVGADDVITNRGQADWLARGIRGARIEIIEGAGHLPPIEQPDEFNSILTRFLEGLRQDAASPASVGY